MKKKNTKNKNNKKIKETEKKQERKIYEDNSNDSKNEMAKLLKIVLIVTGIMLIFYGVTMLVTKKSDEIINEKTENTQTEKTEIQYNNIMIGTMLNYSGTYYVLIEMKDDNRLAEYNSIIDTIKSSEDAPVIYKANLTDSFNKSYLGKEQNYYVDNMADFKVINTTLVKVKDGKITSVYDQHDTITKALNDLA